MYMKVKLVTRLGDEVILASKLVRFQFNENL